MATSNEVFDVTAPDVPMPPIPDVTIPATVTPSAPAAPQALEPINVMDPALPVPEPVSLFSKDITNYPDALTAELVGRISTYPEAQAAPEGAVQQVARGIVDDLIKTHGADPKVLTEKGPAFVTDKMGAAYPNTISKATASFIFDDLSARNLRFPEVKVAETPETPAAPPAVVPAPGVPGEGLAPSPRVATPEIRAAQQVKIRAYAEAKNLSDKAVAALDLDTFNKEYEGFADLTKMTPSQVDALGDTVADNATMGDTQSKARTLLGYTKMGLMDPAELETKGPEGVAAKAMYDKETALVQSQVLAKADTAQKTLDATLKALPEGGASKTTIAPHVAAAQEALVGIRDAKSVEEAETWRRSLASSLGNISMASGTLSALRVEDGFSIKDGWGNKVGTNWTALFGAIGAGLSVAQVAYFGPKDKEEQRDYAMRIYKMQKEDQEDLLRLQYDLATESAVAIKGAEEGGSASKQTVSAPPPVHL